MLKTTSWGIEKHLLSACSVRNVREKKNENPLLAQGRNRTAGICPSVCLCPFPLFSCHKSLLSLGPSILKLKIFTYNIEKCLNGKI